MLLSLLLAPLLALPALAVPNPDLMDLWPTRLVPTGTEPTTMTYAFDFPFPTTVTKVWNAPAADATDATGSGGSGVTSGTALAAAAAAATTGSGGAGAGGGALPFNPLDPNAMTGALAAAFQQQADALLAEVKKQTITIVCAILFGTLGGIALLGGVSGKLSRADASSSGASAGAARTSAPRPCARTCAWTRRATSPWRRRGATPSFRDRSQMQNQKLTEYHRV